MIITDRSRIESGDDCLRKRFWSYQYNGWGLEPDGPPPVDLAYGIGFHEGAEVLAREGPFEDALKNLTQHTDKIQGVTADLLQKKDEYRTLGYGHLRTLSEFILPSLRERYDVVGVETEIVLPLSHDVLDLTRLDVAFKDRETGVNYYVEWKTDSNPSDIGSRMQFNLQFVLGIAALEKALGEPVVGSIIIGVDKGTKRGPSPTESKKGITGERRLSPFTYAYCQDNGFIKQWRLEWTKNWINTPIWTSMTPAEWWMTLQEISPDSARDQFVITEPLYWERAAYESAIRQIVAQERRLEEGTIAVASGADADSIDEYFKMSRKNCRNDGGYRKPCPFIDLCHFGKDSAPLEWGFKWRTENHPLEATLRKRPPTI